MRPAEKLKQTGEVLLQLARQHHALEIRVFGSVARGTDTERSDIDLYVVYDQQASILTHAALACAIEQALATPCDVLCDELTAQASFKKMEEISLPLVDWLNGRRISAGAVTAEDRQSSALENLEWIISRIRETVADLSYEAFLQHPRCYDALAYQLMLLGSIAQNAGAEELAKIQQKYGVDLSGSAKLNDLLLTSVYPRMVYAAARAFK